MYCDGLKCYAINLDLNEEAKINNTSSLDKKESVSCEKNK